MKTKMKWMYDGHREAMKEAVMRTRAIRPDGSLDSEYASALYLLTGMESIWPQLKELFKNNLCIVKHRDISHNSNHREMNFLLC